MPATKECPSCGAQNDIIFTNCIYCKTALPNVDISSISNEDLVMNASEWIGKTNENFIIIKGPKANDWTGKDVVSMKHGEIIGNAEKYLNLIAVRASTNPALNSIYQDLKTKLETNSKRGRTKLTKTLGGFALFFGLFTIIILIIECMG